MNSRQAAIVVALAVVAIGVVTLPASGASDQATNETAANETETNMGTQLTAFMQASAAESNDTVESGMWAAGFERANESDQARLATNRTAQIEQRLQRLQERNRTLQQRYENGSLSEPAYVAQTSQLAGRIAALQSSIDDTANAAQRAGIDPTGIEQLRSTLRNVTTPEIPGVARGVASGGPPANVSLLGGPGGDDAGNGNSQGPPENAGPASADNLTDASNGNATEPSNGGPADGVNATSNTTGTTDETVETTTPTTGNDTNGTDGSDTASDGGETADPGNGGGSSGSDGGSSDGSDGTSGSESSADGSGSGA